MVQGLTAIKEPGGKRAEGAIPMHKTSALVSSKPAGLVSGLKKTALIKKTSGFPATLAHKETATLISGKPTTLASGGYTSAIVASGPKAALASSRPMVLSSASKSALTKTALTSSSTAGTTGLKVITEAITALGIGKIVGVILCIALPTLLVYKIYRDVSR